MQTHKGPHQSPAATPPARVLPRWFRRLTNSTDGVATVEFALVLPILVVLLVISAHFGRILYTTVTIGHAARAGVQYGAQASAFVKDTAGIRLAATAEAINIGTIAVSSQPFCTCETAAPVDCVTGTCPTYGGPPKLYLSVTASKNVSWILPWPSMTGTVPISRTATLRIQ